MQRPSRQCSSTVAAVIIAHKGSVPLCSNRRARKAFEVVGKNAGEFIGGYTMGTISFSLAAETGYLAPMSPYVGYSGYIYGSYHGGREGEYYAGRLFDSMYSVYLVGRKLKRISGLSNFYQQMYDNN